VTSPTGLSAITLSYGRTTGGAPAASSVVLLHGWMCDRADMAAVAALIASDHDVVNVDLRGHGASPAPESGYSIAQLAQDVAVLCRSLRLPPALIVGHSLGGAVAVELACAFPDVVSGVVMIDSPWVLEPAEPAVVESATRLRTGDFGPRSQAILNARTSLSPAGTTLTLPSQEAAAQSFESLMQWPGPDRLGLCATPTTALFSDGSWPKVKDAGQAFGGLVMTHVPGTGHWIQLEAPSAVAGIVREFGARLRGGHTDGLQGGCDA
jgi:pimeloyl-ACP methyl ester carboxylesterase